MKRFETKVSIAALAAFASFTTVGVLAQTLPAPLYLETFDGVAEGGLPAGWSVRNGSDPNASAGPDLGDLNSLSYADWVVVNSERFKSQLKSYDNGALTSDYQRVIQVSSLAEGNIFFANSGYRSGGSQILYATTPDFDLSGKANVFLVFNSLYEQNQDSFGAIEFSVDGGVNWLPVLYLLDRNDLIRDASGNVDAVATLQETRTDAAYALDPGTGEAVGGSYGSFVAAPVTGALAPYLSGRVDDDAIGSKKVEVLRLSGADNQARVRFRLVYAGTDSWYFGIDNFGLYSITGARVTSATPAAGSTGVSPDATVQILLEDGQGVQVATSSIELTFDGERVEPIISRSGGVTTIAFDPPGLLASESAHQYSVTYLDSSTPATVGTVAGQFTVRKYLDLALPAPLHFENFDSVIEGSLPPGWSQMNFTEVLNEEVDLGNLDSAAYAGWTVVEAARFSGSFVTYSNPDNPQSWEDDYQRVLTPNPDNVVNGQIITDLARGRFAFGNSGYRNGRGQVLHLFTPDFDLTGREDIHLSYHSLWEQNQDSIGAVEYSIDQGQTWLPVVYMLATADVLRDANGNVDAVATFTTEYGDLARFTDPATGEEKGGAYGAYIGAPVSADLAPFISARIDDNPAESKRVELFRLDRADNQPRVRFRFTHAGADSWYFGIDNFGLYSLAATPPPVVTKPADQTVPAGASVTFTANVTGAGPFTYQWRFNDVDLPAQTGPTLVLTGVQSTQAGRYAVRVANAGGTTESPAAVLTVTIATEPAVTGQWDFEEGNLKATVGADLEFFNAAAEGATRFGATTSLAIPDIGGAPARVLEFPELNPFGGYIMRHGAAANGGGAYVNQYTVIADVLYPPSSADKWKAFWQTNERNSNDGDFFANPAGGIGIEGKYDGTIKPNTWHRIAFAVDLSAAAGPVLAKFIDGVKVGEQILSSGRDGRWSLYSASDTPNFALLFADESGDNALGYVNSVQFRNGRLSDAAVAALGGPSAAGIPTGSPAGLRIGSISHTGNAVSLAWAGAAGIRLQKTTSLTTKDWQDVPGTEGQSAATETITGAAAFYRLFKL